MRIGICTRPENVKHAPAGLDFIEGTVGDVLCPREGELAFAARLAAAQAAVLPVEAANCFIPADLKTTGPAVDPAALDVYVTTVMERASRIGIRTIVFGSGGSRRVPEGFDHSAATGQLAAHLRRWGSIAARSGIIIALEPLQKSECNIITCVDEGAELVRIVNHPNVRLLVDIYHMGPAGDTPDTIRRAAGLIVHVHNAEHNGRGFLGTKGENHRPFFRALKDIGYTGRISIEAGFGNFDAQLGDAVAELRRQIEES